MLRFLPEVPRLREARHALRRTAQILHERHTAVLVADDQVDVAVAVPVDGGRRDHLQVHPDWTAVRFEPPPRSEARRLARAHVLEVGETVEELPADQIEVAVAVEVC